ncbi:lysosomal acid phosphatase-like protein [Dinothrombium tinctorium]|uniref:Lysosomal acid phosphatase-like protein n=1 Tax=Dinothrombium tinctorium TaxID=1965070 RepID=A0A443QAW4_9ACAR|nr:lysosomal acid phosphatase-like protein [Dinothrombium tinctorium]RWS00425.1 lysosomal acid phosphatase-like protein [Dinothrombium tinctorium]
MKRHLTKLEESTNYLSDRTGSNITIIMCSDFANFLNELVDRNLPLPSFINATILKQMNYLKNDFYFSEISNECHRLKSATLLNKIKSIISDEIYFNNNTKKAYFFSTHQSIIGSLLRTLNYSTVKPVKYAATVIIELHGSRSEDVLNFVKFFYVDVFDSFKIIDISPFYCDFSPQCDWQQFLDKIHHLNSIFANQPSHHAQTFEKTLITKPIISAMFNFLLFTPKLRNKR